METSNHTPISQISSWYYLATLVILIASGTAYFYLVHAGSTLLTFLIATIFIAISRRMQITQLGIFFWVYITLIFLTYIRYGITNALIEHGVFLIGTIFITKSFNYNSFRHTFLNVVVCLACVSLIFYLAYILRFITPNLVYVGGDSSLGFYMYSLHVFGDATWGEHQRLAGIFWEPGIYQMVLNTALIMNYDLILYPHKSLNQKLKLLIIMSCIVLTNSTTGYLILGVTIISVVRNKFSRGLAKKIIALIVSCLFVLLLFSSSVIADKFTADNGSFIIRANDTLAFIRMIIENPLLGSGVNSPTFLDLTSKYDMTGAMSNGLLYITAQYGVIWLISFIVAIKKEYNNRQVKMYMPLYFVAIIFMTMGEPLTYAPLILLYVLPFKQY